MKKKRERVEIVRQWVREWVSEWVSEREREGSTRVPLSSCFHMCPVIDNYNWYLDLILAFDEWKYLASFKYRCFFFQKCEEIGFKKGLGGGGHLKSLSVNIGRVTSRCSGGGGEGRCPTARPWCACVSEREKVNPNQLHNLVLPIMLYTLTFSRYKHGCYDRPHGWCYWFPCPKWNVVLQRMCKPEQFLRNIWGGHIRGHQILWG